MRPRPSLPATAVALVWVAAAAAWAVLLAPADARPVLVAVPDRVVIAGPEERSQPGVPSPVAGPHASSSDPAPATVLGRPAAPLLRESRSAPASPCEAARARSRVPLAAGWAESCAARPGDPAAGRAWNPTMTLHYAAAWVDANVRADRAEAWDWLVAHERCHALRYGTPAFYDEPAANACADAGGAPRPASQPAYH